MFKLLVILYIIKLYAQINIYKHIKKKHGQDVLRNVCLYEKLKTKYMKINADIKYIKSCKKKELTRRFAKVSLALKSGTARLEKKIAKLVMEAELQNKHIEPKKTKKELRSISFNLRATLGLILFNAIIKKTNIVVKSKIKAITYRHEKKLKNLQKLHQNSVNTKTKQHPVKQIIHNCSSYVLSRDEKIVLSYGLDQHIPYNLNKTDIEAEF